MSNLKRERPIIGVLPGWSVLAGRIPDGYLVSVLRGIQSAAHSKGCDLLLAWGLGRISDPGGIYPAWPLTGPNSDFVPVGPWNTDGLIVFAPLRSETRSSYLQKLSADGFPILYIATGEQGPMVAVDNEAGIRMAVAHLVEHGHREIAFVAGDPQDKGDSEARLRAYHVAVAEYDLSSDPRLVAQGGHQFERAYNATKEMIASGVKFTALVASDDSSAIGAMRAMRDAGLRIPTDVAVIGFDDQPDAVAQLPPLTSVHVPLPEMGEQALLMMLEHLKGRQQLESVRIPARLALRQSCGCIPNTISSAADGTARLTHLDKHASLQEIHQELVDAMVAVLPAKSRFQGEEKTRSICAVLVQDFHSSLKKGKPDRFQKSLTEFLHQLEVNDESIDPWQEIISVLRREMLFLPIDWQKPEIRQLAENLLNQARAAISESAQRRDYRHQYQQEIAAQTLSELTARLAVTLDERQAVEFLETSLAAVNVRHARVVLFEPEGDDPVAWSVILSPEAQAPALRFPTRSFPPPGLYPPGKPIDLALVPLVFQDESLGFVAFDGANLEPYALIARQLASTLKASRLYAQVLELSLTDPLTGLSNRRYFDLFLKNEVGRSRRFGSALAVIMLDIDHFKDYNDTFGHPAGDQALQAVAACIRDSRRGADVAARIGGEEFALILPDTQTDGAMAVAEKIRAAVSNLSGLERPITLSAGISVLVGNEVEAARLIQQSDLALYEAKRSGRNQTSLFHDEKNR